MNKDVLLRADSVHKVFPVALRGRLFKKKVGVKAVNQVSFSIYRGETLGLIGESGCGKTTLARCLMRLIDVTSGRIVFEGRDIVAVGRRKLRALRKKMQTIYQDPFSSLNTRKRIFQIVAEPLIVHGIKDREEIEERVGTALDEVGLGRKYLDRYPHELSGGERQRVNIARALALNPSFVIADEPVSALDVSVQAQVLNLILNLQSRLGLTYLFISHDLRVVGHMSDRIAVMYMGRIMELGPASEILLRSVHPYTTGLLKSMATTTYGRAREPVLSGEIPSLVHPPPGCSFHPRCDRKQGRCTRESPQLREVGRGHSVACHL